MHNCNDIGHCFEQGAHGRKCRNCGCEPADWTVICKCGKSYGRTGATWITLRDFDHRLYNCEFYLVQCRWCGPNWIAFKVVAS